MFSPKRDTESKEVGLRILNYVKDDFYKLAIGLELHYDTAVEIFDCRKDLLPKDITNRVLKGKEDWWSCRESGVYHIQDSLLVVKPKGLPDGKCRGYNRLVLGEPRNAMKGEYVLPNFEKGKSFLIISGSEIIPRLIGSEYFLTLVQKIPCMLLSLPFGDRSFDVETEILDNYPVPVYGSPKKERVIKINFPNLFLTSQGTFSVWTCYLRKAIAYSNQIEYNHPPAKDALLKVMESIKDYESVRKIVKRLSRLDQDPFYPITYNEAGLLTNLRNEFPLEFFEFNAKTMGEEGANVFKPECWVDFPSSNGYRNLSGAVYSGSSDSAFCEYLKEMMEEDGKIKKSLKRQKRI